MPEFLYSERDDQVFPELFRERTPVPRVGEFVRLALDNSRSYVNGHTQTTRFMGKVVPMPCDDVPDAFALWVEGNYAPLRVIRLRHVYSINGRRVNWFPGSVERVPQRQPVSRVFEVTGSKGNAYKVWNREGNWTCACTGFGYRHTCRHIAEAQALARAGEAPVLQGAKRLAALQGA
jgi:hypothetical protein